MAIKQKTVSDALVLTTDVIVHLVDDLFRFQNYLITLQA